MIDPRLELLRRAELSKIRKRFLAVIVGAPRKVVEPVLLRFFMQQHVKRGLREDAFFPRVRTLEGLRSDLGYIAGAGRGSAARVEAQLADLDAPSLFEAAASACRLFTRSRNAAAKRRRKRAARGRVGDDGTTDDWEVTTVAGRDTTTWTLTLRGEAVEGGSVSAPLRVCSRMRRMHEHGLKTQRVGMTRFEVLAWCLLFRYGLFQDRGEHLAVPSAGYASLRRSLASPPVDLFASCINSNSERYCSLYEDLESGFGGMGSFFRLEALPPAATFNPPFDELVMAGASEHLVKLLSRSRRKGAATTVVCFLPVWDEEGKRRVAGMCGARERVKFDASFGAFEAKRLLDASGFVLFQRLLCRRDMPYFDAVSGRTVFASNTHVLVLSTDERMDVAMAGRMVAAFVRDLFSSSVE
jgi:Phosphorylated CTD interacting factor 1 WW domain